jgi:hypothetical protein
MNAPVSPKERGVILGKDDTGDNIRAIGLLPPSIISVLNGESIKYDAQEVNNHLIRVLLISMTAMLYY